MRSEPARLGLIVAALLLGEGGSFAEAADTGEVLLERIAAVVDGRPVMLSEVRLLQALRGVDREAAVSALVDERLMLREAMRLPQTAVATEDEERAYRSLLARGPALEGTVPEGELRRLARRQTIILKYIEFRFRPQVRVAEEDVRAAYAAETVGVADLPSYEAAAPRIRERLTEVQLSERVEAWVRELRGAAEVRVNLPEEPAP